MNILRIFFKLIFKYNIKFINNINKHCRIGFDCTFYNYLDGFEQVCSYILPVIYVVCAYLNSLNIIIYIVIRKPIVGGGHRYLDTGSQKFAKYPKKKYPKVSTSIQKYQFLFLFLSINLIH